MSQKWKWKPIGFVGRSPWFRRRNFHPGDSTFEGEARKHENWVEWRLAHSGQSPAMYGKLQCHSHWTSCSRCLGRRNRCHQHCPNMLRITSENQRCRICHCVVSKCWKGNTWRTSLSHSYSILAQDLIRCAHQFPAEITEKWEGKGHLHWCSCFNS